MALTIVLVAAFVVPVVMAVGCVVIARHFYPPGQRFWAGLAGAAGAIGLPILVILGIREWTGLHERLAGELGPLLSMALFAGSSVLAPGTLIWIRRRRRG